MVKSKLFPCSGSVALRQVETYPQKGAIKFFFVTSVLKHLNMNLNSQKNLALLYEFNWSKQINFNNKKMEKQLITQRVINKYNRSL